MDFDALSDAAGKLAADQYIGFGVILLCALVAQAVYVVAATLYIRQNASQRRRRFWRNERRRLDRAIFGLIASVAFVVGTPFLDVDPALEDTIEVASRVVAAVCGGILLLRGISIVGDYLLDRAEETSTRLDDQLVPLMRQTANVFVVLVGGLFVLSNLDVNVGALIAGLGIGGIAVALAAQDTMKNLLGGLTVLADRPFQVGDWVIVGDVEGTVEKIGFRSTRIRTFASSLVSVPNAEFTESVINNITQREFRRYETTLHLPLTTSPEAVQAFCEGVRALLQANTLVRQDYYFCEFERIGDSTIDVLLYCFFDANDWGPELRAKHILNLDILKLAGSLDIELSAPTQTVRVATAKDRPVRTREEIAAALEGAVAPSGAGQAAHRTFTAGFDAVPPETPRNDDSSGEGDG